MNNKNFQILIVEDNLDNCFLLEKILKHHGFLSMTIKDGESALDWCQNNMPDCIFMDISLPGIDGLQVTRQLRQTEGYADIPIYALTAHAIKEVEKETIEAGCTGYITKPFSPKKLIELLNELR